MNSTISLSCSSIGENGPFGDRPYQFERKNRPEKMKNPRVAKLSRMGIWPQIHRMPETSWLGQHHVSANK
jgi:hypothetical protein